MNDRRSVTEVGVGKRPNSLRVGRQRSDAVRAQTKAGPVHGLFTEHELVTVLEDAVSATERQILRRMLEHASNRGLVQDGQAPGVRTRVFVVTACVLRVMCALVCSS